MSPYRVLKGCALLAVWFLAVVLLTCAKVHAADSTCITCHTDEMLLKDNLKQAASQKSALQAGSG